MPDDSSNQPQFGPNDMVVVKGGDGRPVRYGDLVYQDLEVFARKWSLVIEDLWAAAHQMYSAAQVEVDTVLHQLRADLTPLDDVMVCGTEDPGTDVRIALQKAIPAVLRVVGNVPPNLEAFGAGLQETADTAQRADEDVLQRFRDKGFDVPATGLDTGPGVY
jgi:hypothetical protein